MKINKKAQGEIITTVLIILLVLAAIIIVWQVVSNAVKSGGKTVETQTGCLGISIELTNSTPLAFSVKRSAAGDDFTSASIVIIKDGTRLTTTSVPVAPDVTTSSLEKPLGTATFSLLTASSTVEVAYIANGDTCPLTAKVG